MSEQGEERRRVSEKGMDFPQGVCVRRARLSDYQAVLDINRQVYGGADYIPYSYHQLVTDPDFAYYVCLVNGEVAAFEGVCLLDDNKSMMTRSVRVKDKFQGQGLLAQIRRKIHEDFKGVSGEKNLRAACSNLIRYIHSKTFRSQNKTLLIERVIHLQEIDPGQIIPPAHVDFEDVRAISYDQFGQLLHNKALTKYLFPNDLITAASWFYDALPSNVRHIKKITQRILITSPLFGFLGDNNNEEQDRGVTDKLTTSEQREECKMGNPTHGLLALVSHYYSPAYLLFAINFFGQPTSGLELNDVVSILKHAFEYMKTLYTDGSKNQPALIFPVTNQKFPEQIVWDATRRFGLQGTTWEGEFTHQYYFEQHFDSLLKN